MRTYTTGSHRSDRLGVTTSVAAPQVAEVSAGTRQPPRAAALLGMQAVLGNRAVQLQVARSRPQAQLLVGSGRDAAEQEADRVAESVMGMTTPVQALAPASAPRLDVLQRAGGAGGFAAGAGFERRLNTTRGGGTPLPTELRGFMESRFGADFGAVRLHAGREAAELNHEAGARAFTLGADIYLGAGETDLGSPAARRLLAHELTHTIQQGAVGGAGAVASPVMQRYSIVEGTATRYSDGHQIMWRGKKDLWAQTTKIEECNEILVKRGSYVVLAPTGLSFTSAFGGTLAQVEPRWNADRPKPRKQDRERVRLAKANAASEGYITHADCFMNAQTVMGVADSPTGIENKTHPILDGKSLEAVSSRDMTDKYGGTGLTAVLGGGSPSRGHYTFVMAAFIEFFPYLKTDVVQLGPLKDAADTFHAAYAQYAGKQDKAGLNGLLRAYAELRTNVDYAPLLDAFSRMFAINEYLSPGVGEGLAVLNDPNQRKESQDEIAKRTRAPDDELWNYHFAGVIMKDGTDFVTLENYSVGRDSVDNDQWMFQMYGVGAQSFHAEMSGKQGIGTKSMTLGFTADKPAVKLP